MVVDAHHHFWDPARRDYPWMGVELAAIRRRFGPEDLAALLAETGVDRTVLVQTISSLDETREFLATAAATDFIAGVVGWIDLTDSAVADTLAELQSGPGGKFLVGIRHQVHDEPDPQWLLRADVQRGIQAVGDAGLVYDLLVKTRELPSAVETARRNPDMRFVLDHMAKPRIAAEPRDQDWERALAPLADYRNVSCKLSGLVTEAAWSDWTPEDLQPYVARALEWFGSERCLFGSDWPVCLVASEYSRVVRTMRTIVGENALVFGATAARVYRLA
ncbi:MAG: amidohydrolase [Chloroflexi bacterium 13_1_40CM_3_65_12]|nr:MAG: amidohydrolase [Chloroflexi bacterium 13_1_40CM_65_17]OLD23987.1 MAG: amidohydrolase [Chloroflexi bacterium 13_1_40CM_3_65_12]